MARYIDAELLKEVVLGWEPPLDDEQLEREIDTMPTVDVAEVKHGEWKYECLECSVCKRNISEIYDADSYMASGIEYELLFCPYCGAKMDGGKEE